MRPDLDDDVREHEQTAPAVLERGYESAEHPGWDVDEAGESKHLERYRQLALSHAEVRSDR